MLIDNISPDAYLFEFSNGSGKAAAEVEVEAFKAKIMTMKSVQIRQEFRLLLNGFSAKVKDQDELREIMSWPGLQRVSPLVSSRGNAPVSDMARKMFATGLATRGQGRSINVVCCHVILVDHCLPTRASPVHSKSHCH
jgi:hypothetical protein